MSRDGAYTVHDLEHESYFKPNFYNVKDEVTSKIEEFSYWFNNTARLFLLRCDNEDYEVFAYLLLNLKKNIESAVSEINLSASNCGRTFTCSICGEIIVIEPWQNLWSTLQQHPHFEEMYSQFDTNVVAEYGESSTNGSTADDLTEDLSQMALIEADTNAKAENNLNDFRFNFVVTYDKRVEESLYPDSLMAVARNGDKLPEHTIQRCGAARGMCLLCPCPLVSMSKSRAFKINSFTIKNHVLGQRHLKFATMEINKDALRRYHEFWRSQEPNYQAHQVYFVPELVDINSNRCQLCLELVPYLTIVSHIQDKPHKTRVLQIFCSPEGKLNEFYLIGMQVEIYGVMNHTASKREEKQAKQNDDVQNGEVTPPKCSFVKYVPQEDAISLPARYKDHLKFLTQKGDLVQCDICKMNFSKRSEVIRNHILSSQHKQLSGISSPKYGFFCEICNLHMKDEYAWGEHFVRGPNRHNNMPELRQKRVAEYECKPCMLVIYGDDLSLARHISSGGKTGRAREVKLPYAVKKLFKSKDFIEEEATRLQVEANKVFAHQDAMDECCEDLEEAVSAVYPSCKAHAFGSRMSGLGNNQSDLDVFMDIGDMYLGENDQDSVSQEKFVKKVSKMLKTCKEDFGNVVPIPSARTPIVKLRHNYTKLECDVSFRHGLGVENTKFLKFCIDLQPITQPFILFLKKWSDYCKLNEHITNYGLALMAVFFLQTQGYLLSVTTVRTHNPTQSSVIDGWETLRYTAPIGNMKKLIKPCTLSMKELLRDFFLYFSKFDYANNVVCPLLGSLIPKLYFNERPNESLPPEMKSYVQRLQSENSEQFRALSPFCIQDPFDLSHNLTKACQQGTISKLKTFSTLTWEFLETIE